MAHSVCPVNHWDTGELMCKASWWVGISQDYIYWSEVNLRCEVFLISEDMYPFIGDTHKSFPVWNMPYPTMHCNAMHVGLCALIPVWP